MDRLAGGGHGIQFFELVADVPRHRDAILNHDQLIGYNPRVSISPHRPHAHPRAQEVGHAALLSRVQLNQRGGVILVGLERVVVGSPGQRREEGPQDDPFTTDNDIEGGKEGVGKGNTILLFHEGVGVGLRTVSVRWIVAH